MGSTVENKSTKSGPLISRRALLRQASCGFGTLGLAGLFNDVSNIFAGTEPANPMAPKGPNFIPKAKRVIFLFMHGGPSSIDTFDPKPRLDRDDGKPLPMKVPRAFTPDKLGGLMKSPWVFKRYGQSGIPVSDLFPMVGAHVDDLCVIRS